MFHLKFNKIKKGTVPKNLSYFETAPLYFLYKQGDISKIYFEKAPSKSILILIIFNNFNPSL